MFRPSFRPSGLADHRGTKNGVFVAQVRKRLKSLFAGSGPVLFLLRLPFRLTKTVADIGTTRLYGVFLGAMGPGCHIEYGARIENPRYVFLGRNVKIGKGTLVVSEVSNAELHIGDSVQINRSCHIDHTGVLRIGAGTIFSEGVIVYSHSHGVDPRSKPCQIRKEIGADCWIGARAMLLENVETLADNTLVAAGSVLTKSIIVAGSIYAGVPATRIADR